MKSLFTLLVLLFSLVLQSQPASADPAQFNGKSLDQWFKSYYQWYHNGSHPLRYAIGGVRFLPLPQPVSIPVDPNNPYPQLSWFGGKLDISMKANQYLLISLSAWNGERYNNGTPDDAPSILLDYDVFNDTTISITVDRKPFFTGTAQQLNTYHFGPVYFDQPIPYSQPHDNGAIAAIWEEGTGLLYPPLAEGRHTLEIVAITPVFGVAFDNKWNITVEK
jgi:hypothetical protein